MRRRALGSALSHCRGVSLSAAILHKQASISLVLCCSHSEELLRELELAQGECEIAPSRTCVVRLARSQPLLARATPHYRTHAGTGGGPRQWSCSVQIDSRPAEPVPQRFFGASISAARLHLAADRTLPLLTLSAPRSSQPRTPPRVYREVAFYRRVHRPI